MELGICSLLGQPALAREPSRVHTALMGRENVATPTLASLQTNFGLAPLIGKPLAIISDARLGADLTKPP